MAYHGGVTLSEGKHLISLSYENLLKAQQHVIRENDIEQLQPAVNLKVSIMNKFICIAILYFSFELVINGLIPSVELAAKQTTHSSN